MVSHSRYIFHLNLHNVCVIISRKMKTKGQLPVVTQLGLAFVHFADVGKRSNPSPLQGGAHQLRGFKSHRRLQLKAPVEAATSSRAVITTAEAIATRKLIIGFLAVDLKEIHSDLPQLPYRMP